MYTACTPTTRSFGVGLAYSSRISLILSRRNVWASIRAMWSTLCICCIRVLPTAEPRAVRPVDTSTFSYDIIRSTEVTLFASTLYETIASVGLKRLTSHPKLETRDPRII